MSKNRYHEPDPTEQELAEEMIYSELTKTGLPKALILDTFLRLYAHPKHQHEHWISTVTMAIEIVKHVNEI